MDIHVLALGFMCGFFPLWLLVLYVCLRYNTLFPEVVEAPQVHQRFGPGERVHGVLFVVQRPLPDAAAVIEEVLFVPLGLAAQMILRRLIGTRARYAAWRFSWMHETKKR